ncbi:hypothetical protein MJO28_014089 [Puccinia striiformis f. sp. tritici]|uniref:Uncharacterized protein n=1 Tax=Puccinia striiformis f. sp. tritici TaxID=168172 RepID=A0ACC0DZ63_9BASI|nr:hypothetical protein MJO28_014089 [Puccinia striiformis f. sp. tritici]
MTNNPNIDPIFFQSPPKLVVTSSEVVSSSIPAPSADNSCIPALSSVDNIPTMDLLPPPELSYKTHQELHDVAQQWAKNHGYAVIKGNTNLSEQRYNCKCDKSGKCPSTGAKLDGQSGKTKKTSCPFHFTGSFYKRTGLFQIKIQNPNHNHPPSQDPSVHPIHRRLKPDQKHLVEQLIHAGVAPLQIKSALMQESSNPISTTLSTIYNHRVKMRIESLQGRSPMEAQFYGIREQGFYYSVRSDDEGHLTSIFFSLNQSRSPMEAQFYGIREQGFYYSVRNDDEGHLTSIFFSLNQSLTLAKRFTTTFLLDCTSGTTKHKWPLLHIVGINSTNKSFSVAFCYLSEEEEDYIWALEQLHLSLDSIPPSVLITFKEQALINALEKVYPNAAHLLCTWHTSKNIRTYCHQHYPSEEAWKKFHDQWLVFIYSKTTSAYQENFTKLSMLWEKNTGDYIINNWLPLKEKFISLYTALIPSHKLLKTPIKTSVCTGNFSSSMGIACNHQIHQADREGTQFTIDDFHQQWHIQMDWIPENHTEALPDSITAPTKENNENQYLTDLFN